jgi:hypothetical protein
MFSNLPDAGEPTVATQQCNIPNPQGIATTTHQGIPYVELPSANSNRSLPLQGTGYVIPHYSGNGVISWIVGPSSSQQPSSVSKCVNISTHTYLQYYLLTYVFIFTCVYSHASLSLLCDFLDSECSRHHCSTTTTTSSAITPLYKR